MDSGLIPGGALGRRLFGHHFPAGITIIGLRGEETNPESIVAGVATRCSVSIY